MTERVKELRPEALYRACKDEDFTFTTTADLEEPGEIPGQERAAEAVRFGLGIDHDGYNIFAFGPSGSGKHSLAEHFVRERAAARPVAPDLCYVNNFAEPNKPSLLSLPPGLGSNLRNDLKEFIEEVATALPVVFESDEYQARLQAIKQSVKAGPEQASPNCRPKPRRRA